MYRFEENLELMNLLGVADGSRAGSIDEQVMRLRFRCDESVYIHRYYTIFLYDTHLLIDSHPPHDCLRCFWDAREAILGQLCGCPRAICAL